MGATEWYYAQGDTQIGPISAAEMKRLAAVGTLRQNDPVWREGMQDWVPARQVKGLFEGLATISQAPSEPPRIAVPTAAPRRRGSGQHLFDRMLQTARTQLNPSFLRSTAAIFSACGHYGLYAAMVLCFACPVALAPRDGLPRAVAAGIGGAAALALLQYAAGRFSGALERLTRITHGTLGTAALPECLALFCMLGGIAALLWHATAAVTGDPLIFIPVGVAYFILLEYLAILALNLDTLNVTVVPETRASEEAIGLLFFLGKLLLQLVVVAHGVGVVLGTLGLLYSLLLLLLHTPAAGVEGVGHAASTLATRYLFASSLTLVVVAAALPLLAYIAFLSYCFLVELFRAIVAGPKTSDKPTENGGD